MDTESSPAAANNRRAVASTTPRTLHGTAAASRETSFYQYESIPSPKNLEYTRVLELAPGEGPDPLCGSLVSMSVVDPQPFEALSYVWGWGHHPEIIICDDKPLEITSSLAVALRRLRDPVRTRTVWADQVCINQQDLTERSQQVRHMNSIYQKAARVLVWLGLDEGNDAPRAFALTKALAGVAADPARLEAFRSRLAEGDLDQFPEADWTSFGRLFKLPYFDRKWILQEIGTDAPTQLLWGDTELEWAHMSRAADLLKSDGFALRRRHDLLVWKPWYMDRLFSRATYETKLLNFTYELHRARWQRTGDPRDHIFALLGHPSAQEGDNGARVVEADYTKPVDKVYHEFVVRMLEKGGFFMILNTVQHASADLSIGESTSCCFRRDSCLTSAGFKDRNLPTWVTQWDSQEGLHHILGDDNCPFQPAGDLSLQPDRVPNLTFLEDKRALSINGAVIDTISFLGDVIASGDVTLESPRLAHLWSQQPEAGPPGPITAGDGVALSAFLETLSAVKTRKGDVPNTRAQRVADGADFLCRAASNSVTVADDVRTLAEGGDCRKWMERVSGGARGRRFARGGAACFALVPSAATVGDRLCVLFGTRTAFCLRPSGEGYLFVGECYVEGFMDGRWLDDGAQRTTFTIR